MPAVTLAFAALLVVLGVGSYVGTGMSSATALIPAGFGVVLGVLGLLARKESIRKHVMHVAAMVALLGFLGAARGFAQLPALLSGGDVERPVAVWAQVAMAVLCLTLEILYVRSFIAARRAGTV